MTTDVIQASYDTLETIASRFGRTAFDSAELQKRVERCVTVLEQGGWEGRGATAFFAEMHGEIYPALKRLSHALETARSVTLEATAIIRRAEEEAADPFRHGMLPGVPLAVAAAAGAGDSATDRRNGLRAEADERWRRPPGGERGGSHLDYDWAGGAILDRYLTGGGDWNIKNDPQWTTYMQSNPALTNNLRGRALDTAQRLVQSGAGSTTINETFPMEIENGEGVVGYQYLHGTNANAGGFQRQGTATVTPNNAGGYKVQLNTTYTWNDVIDPNPQYATDTWKSRFAEVVTLGRADPYEIHISWDETTVVQLDSHGNPISIRNQ